MIRIAGGPDSKLSKRFGFILKDVNRLYVQRFEQHTFSAADCRDNADRFRPEAFRDAIRQFLTEKFPALFPAGWSDIPAPYAASPAAST